MLKVFVYGTLKPREVNYGIYCQGKTIEETQAYTWGQLYHLTDLGYPGMTMGSNRIEGYLLTFSDERILAALDQLETYNPQGDPELNEYYRELMPVYSLSGQYLGEAWGYRMTWAKVQEFGGVALHSSCWEGNLVS